MPATLTQIIESARRRAAEAKRTADVRKLELRAEAHVPRGFRGALQVKSSDGVAIIAELKKASPSKGLIRANFNPTELAQDLANSGAAALSVLTDEEYFQGSLENLRNASGATAIPCLRKDFIVDEFQLLESRANSADAVLLILSALEQREFEFLHRKASGLGLDVLCEVHDQDELKRAVDAGCDLIGVNTRDLKTFKVDASTTFRLAERLPKNAICVAESGIRSADDISSLRAAGYEAFLVGESLMRAEHPGDFLRELVASRVVA